MKITKPERTFVPADANLDSWDVLQPLLEELQNRELGGLDELSKWIQDLSEFEAVLEEHVAWKYIKMTIDTSDESLAKDYQNFVTELQPKIAPYSNALNKKLAEHPQADKLNSKAYQIYLTKLGLEIKLFREENIPLQAELRKKSQEYGAITGAMNVEHNGETITMPAAGALLQKPDRSLRHDVYEAISKVRLEKKDEIDGVFDELIKGRDTVAKNADFKNFRDYAFDMLARVDYTPEDCMAFHEGIANGLVPLTKNILLERKEQMGVEDLKPYDLSVDPSGLAPLKPFDDGKELIEKSIAVFDKVDPYFGDCLSTMKELGHLDLESKTGKAPGGYNYPLYEIGVPFIFMNAVGTQRDMVTMMHEGGHAVHSFLTRDLPVTSFKSCPSEVAELASMAMELISMDHWDIFYTNEAEL
ncbi:MAG: M3 family oligoendopeptidase, partial [Flavobacteriales bacterium]|nr:M3 family oligoendopeptidase [Flavobacteriales bacterium]